jgi:tetratricopeptide (TPR) repeat protein
MWFGRTRTEWMLAGWLASAGAAGAVSAQDTTRAPARPPVASDSLTATHTNPAPSTTPPGTTSDGPAPAPQTAANYIATGDRDHAAMQPSAALADYEHAIALDSNDYEALYKAARDAVDLGEFEPDATVKQHDFDIALHFARRAVAVNPSGPDGHFHVARALGREALAVGGKKRIQYAKEVRSEALTALSEDPQHPGALHVMGVWNAEVMRLSGIERFIARNLLGGGILGTASWKDAVHYMEESVAIEPKRIVHHLDLGKIYADTGDKAKAREQFEMVMALPAAEYNDPHYKQDAEHQLARL